MNQVFKKNRPTDLTEIRHAAIVGARRRVRPALMTSATTILALLPILTATGRGADVMVPMAIPTFGGMLLALMTIFLIPVLYTQWEEMNFQISKILKKSGNKDK